MVICPVNHAPTTFWWHRCDIIKEFYVEQFYVEHETPWILYSGQSLSHTGTRYLSKLWVGLYGMYSWFFISVTPRTLPCRAVVALRKRNTGKQACKFCVNCWLKLPVTRTYFQWVGINNQKKIWMCHFTSLSKKWCNFWNTPPLQNYKPSQDQDVGTQVTQHCMI